MLCLSHKWKPGFTIAISKCSPFQKLGKKPYEAAFTNPPPPSLSLIIRRYQDEFGFYTSICEAVISQG